MIPYFNTLPPVVQTAGTVIGSSLVASAYIWWTKRRGVENPEPFKLDKAGVTMGVAFVLSLALYGTGTVANTEKLLARVSPFVGPIALWAQSGIKRFQRTGEISLTNAHADEAAEALGNALGIDARDILALAGPTSGFDFGTENRRPANEEKARLAKTSETDPREDPKRPEERDHSDAPDPVEVPEEERELASTSSGTSGNDGVSVPAEEGSTSVASTSSNGMGRHLDQEAAQRIKATNHRTLQKVAGQLEGVDGSGHDPMPLSEQLQQIDSGAVLKAFDAIEDDAFQLED